MPGYPILLGFFPSFPPCLISHQAAWAAPTPPPRKPTDIFVSSSPFGGIQAKGKATGGRELHRTWLCPHSGFPFLSRPRDLETLDTRCPGASCRVASWGHGEWQAATWPCARQQSCFQGRSNLSPKFYFSVRWSSGHTHRPRD